MSFQAYLETVRNHTGKTPDDLRRLAEEEGLLTGGAVAPGVKAGEVVAWLARDFGLGRGHAMAVWALFSGLKTIDSP